MFLNREKIYLIFSLFFIVVFYSDAHAEFIDDELEGVWVSDEIEISYPLNPNIDHYISLLILKISPAKGHPDYYIHDANSYFVKAGEYSREEIAGDDCNGDWFIKKYSSGSKKTYDLLYINGSNMRNGRACSNRMKINSLSNNKLVVRQNFDIFPTRGKQDIVYHLVQKNVELSNLQFDELLHIPE